MKYHDYLIIILQVLGQKSCQHFPELDALLANMLAENTQHVGTVCYTI